MKELKIKTLNLPALMGTIIKEFVLIPVESLSATKELIDFFSILDRNCSHLNEKVFGKPYFSAHSDGYGSVKINLLRSPQGLYANDFIPKEGIDIISGYSEFLITAQAESREKYVYWKNKILTTKISPKELRGNIGYLIDTFPERLLRNQSIPEEIVANIVKYEDSRGLLDLIVIYCVLPENLIEEYRDKLNWDLIIRYQSLSKSFLEKILKHFSDGAIRRIIKDQDLVKQTRFYEVSINRGIIGNYQVLPQKLQNLPGILIMPDNTLYKDLKYKKKRLRREKHFSTIGEKVIGYLVIEPNDFIPENLSKTIQPGKIYISEKVTPVPNDEGFGFTLSKTPTPFKCKADINDIVSFGRTGEILRVSKIEVLFAD